MVKRRPTGALEAEVLAVLWANDHPLTPREVLTLLDTDLAYTTVMTILSRLWEKGMVHRGRRGRAYTYVPSLSEADLRAQRMREALAAARDREATLSRFVDTLTDADAAVLRALLEDLEEEARG